MESAFAVGDGGEESFATNPIQLPAQSSHPLPQQSPVSFKLHLARPAQANAPPLSLEVRPSAHQSRRKMLELGQFDLQLAFACPCAECKNVKD